MTKGRKKRNSLHHRVHWIHQNYEIQKIIKLHKMTEPTNRYKCPSGLVTEFFSLVFPVAACMWALKRSKNWEVSLKKFLTLFYCFFKSKSKVSHSWKKRDPSNIALLAVITICLITRHLKPTLISLITAVIFPCFPCCCLHVGAITLRKLRGFVEKSSWP